MSELARLIDNNSLANRLKMATGKECAATDEALTDGLFELFKTATKHTIAHVMQGHQETIVRLMGSEYARTKKD